MSGQTDLTQGVKHSAAAFNRPGPHLVLRDFLGAETVARLLDYAARHESEFLPSGISDNSYSAELDLTKRRSMRLAPVPELEPLIQARIDEVFDQVIAALGTKTFEPRRAEIELVAHGDGAFFLRHLDTMTGESPLPDGSPRAARMLTMVYYFCRTPPRFTGGVLRLHSIAATGEPGSFVDIQPENDTALFFPSWFPHEVLPVSLPGGEFMDSRFAINLWLYR